MPKQTTTNDVKPSDKYARSDQAPPPGKPREAGIKSGVDSEDIVEEAVGESFPASDPPAYAGRTVDDVRDIEKR